MNLDDLLEEFKDEHHAKKAAAGKHHMNQQDSATFSNGSGDHHAAGHSKFSGNHHHAEEDPWGNIPSAKVTHTGLVPPKQIYAQQSAGNGWEYEDDAPDFGRGNAASKGYAMTPKFGHESAASGQSHRAENAKKSSRNGAGGDDLDDLIDDISGKDVTTGSVGSFKY